MQPSTTNVAEKEIDDVASLPINRMDPRGDVEFIVGTKPAEQNESEPPRRFLVCSRTLARVSPVFDRMLYGQFIESKRAAKDDEDWIVELEEDKPSAMEVFLAISHGHLNRAPPSLGTQELYDLTMLTHYYDSTKILVPWIRPWIGALHDPTSMPDDAMARVLWISWELGHRQMFEATVRRLTMEGPGGVFAEGSMLHDLHMPTDIVERICTVREETINALLSVFRNFIDLMTVVDERARWCQHATYMGPHRCESMILGSITFCLTRASLWPIPDDPAGVDYSILGLYEVLSNLVIHDIGQPVRGEDNHQECNPREYLADQMKDVLDKIVSPQRDEDRERMTEQAKKLHMM